MKTTSPKSLSRVPTKCPRCGSWAVSWSPKRVWCTMCSFQTATRFGETSRHTVVRWNRAINDGVGYYTIVQENNARESSIYNPLTELFS